MKKMILALLVAGACWSAPLHAKDWASAPLVEVQKAAEQGDSGAQLVLGLMYYFGHRLSPDDLQAAAWLRKAAEQGNSDAQCVLGTVYLSGRGVPQNDKQAVAWYRKASEQGNAEAQSALGAMYFDGRGVPQSSQQAYAWFSVAAANGYDEAAAWRGAVAEKLTPAALAEAQALAGRYFEQYQPKP